MQVRVSLTLERRQAIQDILPSIPIERHNINQREWGVHCDYIFYQGLPQALCYPLDGALTLVYQPLGWNLFPFFDHLRQPFPPPHGGYLRLGNVPCLHRLKGGSDGDCQTVCVTRLG